MGEEEEEEGVAQAQISWYTASRSSVLPCASLRPFLEAYEVPYCIELVQRRTE